MMVVSGFRRLTVCSSVATMNGFLGLTARGIGLGLLCTLSCAHAEGPADPRWAAVGQTARAPIGWVEFCTETPDACKAGDDQPKTIVLSQKSWSNLVRVNKWVNDTVKPVTDMDHWGLVERWSIPTDGYGDCEDYVLMKRKMLIDAGWPASALLVTVVRDRDEGHAVLTVNTDRGDLILDNKREDILLWRNTGYRFVKRQSNADPNVWIALGDALEPAKPVAETPMPRPIVPRSARIVRVVE
jgi:predicted transglutaminase-like cysteine proteinase